MNFIKYVTASALLLSSVPGLAQSPTETCPFQQESISNPPGEGNVGDRPYFKHLENLQLEVPEAVRRANRKFFDLVPNDCLGKGMIVDTRTKKVFYYYNTIEDSCDGGNTFGIIVSEDSPRAVADIADGEIYCLP